MTSKQSRLFEKEFTILRNLARRDVEGLVDHIILLVRPFCVKVEIAGSYRRRKDVVNDLDFVVLPRGSENWDLLLGTVIHDLEAKVEKRGSKLATLHVPFAFADESKGKGYVSVDFYHATPETWGILLLIRTGSAEHNIYLCNLALRKGYRLAYSKGLLNEKGEVLASKTEQDVFQALGLDYIAPQDREMKEG